LITLKEDRSPLADLALRSYDQRSRSEEDDERQRRDRLFFFPGPLYEGNGTHQLFFDENTTEEQRDALEKLWSGEYGGPFFEIFSTIAPNKRDTRLTLAI
jgi:hypothetical protein